MPAGGPPIGPLAAEAERIMGADIGPRATLRIGVAIGPRATGRTTSSELESLSSSTLRVLS